MASPNDFYALDTGKLNLKYYTGIAQMVFATILFLINKYFIEEGLIQFASFGLFAFGFFLVGLRYQTLVSPTGKFIQITRGFFFLVFKKEFRTSDISGIRVGERTRRGTDSNGIGPTRENKLITTYYAELVLKNDQTKTLISGRERKEVENFAARTAEALEVPFSAPNNN